MILLLTIYIFNYLNVVSAIGVWKQVNYNDPGLISPREYSAGAFFNQTQEFFVAGGVFMDFPEKIVYNDLYAINITSLQITQLPDLTTTQAGSNEPALLYGSAYTSDPVSGTLFIQGGFGIAGALRKFDVIERKWAFVLANGTQVPKKRSFHCIELHQESNQLILFGGLGDVIQDDLWVFDLKISVWTQRSKPDNVGASIWVQGRSKSSCAIGSGKFYVHGGVMEHKIAQDLWQFDFRDSKWTLLSAGTSKVKAMGHSMKYIEKLDALMLFMGFPNPGIFQYELKNRNDGWVSLSSGDNAETSVLNGIQNFVTGYNAKSGEYYVFAKSKDGSSNKLWAIQLEESQSSSVSSSKPTPKPTTTKPVITTTIASKSKGDKQNQDQPKTDPNDGNSTEGYGSFYIMLFFFMAVLMVGFYLRLRKKRSGAPRQEYNQLQNVTNNISPNSTNSTNNNNTA